MNEKRMKTSVNTGELSLDSAQGSGRGVQTDGERGCGSEKQGFDVEKWVDKPSDGRKIVETTGKTQFDALNNRANGEFQIDNKNLLFWASHVLDATQVKPPLDYAKALLGKERW